jgi:hypothetical protein
MSQNNINNDEFVNSVLEELGERMKVASDHYVRTYGELACSLVKHGLPLEEGWAEKLQERGVVYQPSRTMHDLSSEEAGALHPLFESFQAAANEIEILGPIYPDSWENPFPKFDNIILDTLKSSLSETVHAPQGRKVEGKWSQAFSPLEGNQMKDANIQVER